MPKLLIDFSRRLGLFRFIQKSITQLLAIVASLNKSAGISTQWFGIDEAGGWKYSGRPKLRGKALPACDWQGLAGFVEAMQALEENVVLSDIEKEYFHLQVLTNTSLKSRCYVLYADESFVQDIISAVDLHNKLLQYGPSELLSFVCLEDSDGSAISRSQIVAATKFDPIGVMNLAFSHAENRDALALLMKGFRGQEVGRYPAEELWEFHRTWGGLCIAKERVESDYDNWQVIVRCLVENNKQGIGDLLASMDVAEPARSKCASAIFSHRETVKQWSWLLKEMIPLYEKCRNLLFAPAIDFDAIDELDIRSSGSELEHAFSVSIAQHGCSWIHCNRYIALWILKVMLLVYCIKKGEYRKAGLVLGYDPKLQIVPNVSARQAAVQALMSITSGWTARVEDECAKIITYIRSLNSMPEQLCDACLL